MKKWIAFFAGILCGTLIWFAYSQLSESQKRYIAHLAKQVWYMPARYKV